MSADAEAYNRIHAILDDARKLSGPELDRFLGESCGPDEELRASVLKLLAAGSDEQASDLFAEEYVVSLHRELAGLQEDTLASWLPEKIGVYTIERQIGQGGMGVVYEAEQESPRRKVAIKLLHPMHATPDSRRRFRREAQLLGRLQHPGIAQIIEASTYDLGHGSQPFFAMELVDGLPLTDYAEANGLDVRARLELIARLCDVVEYAHAKGVIHRDLKPANILVTAKESSAREGMVGTRDASRARLKILDFGIARATDSDLTAATLQTSEGQLVGTISYMSPEQASGDAETIDGRSDVYAVGVLAYELLAGHLPLRTHGKLLHEAVRVVREDEPSALGTLDRALRGDVETIVVKALEKDRGRRYASAAELASDIRRHLSDQPIAARPPSTFYQLGKFARRNKALVGGSLATLLVAITGAGVATSFAVDATRHADELTQVTAYQATHLASIEPREMGLELRELFLSDRRAAMQKDGAEGLERRMAELEDRIAGTNFTNIALEVLDKSFFSKAQMTLRDQFVDQPALEARLLAKLGETMRVLGLMNAAMEPHRRALELRRRVLGEDHPDTLESRHHVGYLLFHQGDIAGAEAMMRAVLERRRETLPGDHPDLWLSLAHMSQLLSSVGNKEECVRIRRELVACGTRIRGAGHPRTLQSRADLLVLEGRPEEAVACLRNGLAAFRESLGDEDLSTTITMGNLAELLLSVGQAEEAESLAREALTKTRLIAGEGSPYLMEALKLMSGILQHQGRPFDVQPLLREALAMERKHLGEEHATTLATARSLDELLEALESSDAIPSRTIVR